MVRWQKVASLILCVACAAVCAAFFVPEQEQELPVAQCEMRLVRNTFRVSGVLVPKDQSVVLPPSVLPVSAVYVSEGDRVSPGQALYRLDTSTLEAQLALLLGQRQLAEAVFAGQGSALSAQIQLIEAQIAACTVRSTRDGTVVEVQVSQGELAQGGIILAESGFAVAVSIPNSRVGEVSEGATVTVTRDSVSYLGELGALKAGSDGTFEAQVSLWRKPDLPTGAVMQADILVGEIYAQAVPLEALFLHEDAVLCVVDGIAVKAAVAVLEQDSTHAAVEGIALGTTVVLYPDDVPEGTRVRHEAP